jgi:CRISPR-associated protein Cmr4
MKSHLYGLLAETPIHPGAGQSSGFVDLPVAREAATDYPVIVGSSMKGAILGASRDRAMSPADLRFLFGSAEIDSDSGGAGGLLVSDARLLLLPVRSLTSHFKWVTCPHLIERYMRDCKRSGLPVPDTSFDFDAVGEDDTESPKYLSAETGELFLEERQLSNGGAFPAGLSEVLKPLILHSDVRQRLDRQLVVVSDVSFAWFARYGLAINARNVLDKETKTSMNLWYEETLPPDSLFYLLLAERSKGNGALDKAQTLFTDRPYLQVGGNETVGHGWFAVSEPLKGGQ